jgi:ATP-dependent Clp protease, protease subunit
MKILNQNNKLKISINGDIGDSFFSDGHTLKSVKAQLQDDTFDEVEVELQSNGGDLIEGFAIYDLFRAMPQKVTVTMTGAVASAGTIVAMGADVRQITPNGQFLIHKPTTITAGDSGDHEAAAEMLKRFDNEVLDIYRKVTGKRKSELMALMEQNKFISAKEAKEWGFVDKITNEKILNQLKETKMEAVLNYFDAKDEAAVIAKAKATAEQLATVTVEAETLKTENEQLKAEIDKFTNQRNDSILANAIENGKITDSEKATWLNLLQKDFDSAKKAIEGMKAPGTLKNFMQSGGGKPAERDYDWYAKNDMKALMAMQETNRDEYDRIINAKFAKNKLQKKG